MNDTTKKERNDKSKKNPWQELLAFRKQVQDAEIYDRLKKQKEEDESFLPPINSPQAKNGVQIAPSGSMVIKGNTTPDWLPGSEYLILGKFTAQALEEEEE